MRLTNTVFTAREAVLYAAKAQLYKLIIFIHSGTAQKSFLDS